MDNNDIIVLNDNDGNELEFELLDWIILRGKAYAVLLGNRGEDDEVVIMHLVGKYTNIGDWSFTGVKDQKIIDEVFDLFQRRNADKYNFEE